VKHVVIQLRLPEALTLQSGQSAPPEVEAILQIIKEAGGELSPVHPGSMHPLLAPFFFVDLPDTADAHEMISQLLASPAVVSAYTEPNISPPR
jgi:hypothetical protein